MSWGAYYTIISVLSEKSENGYLDRLIHVLGPRGTISVINLTHLKLVSKDENIYYVKNKSKS